MRGSDGLRLHAGLAALLLLATAGTAQEGASTRTRHVLLVTVDGVRWQEVFRGADPALIDRDAGGVANPEELRARYWRDTAEQRRQTLMSFFWSTVAVEGAVWGHRDAGSEAEVRNGRNFSYPGYSELLTGFPDPRIDSNAKRENPNRTVLEWLAGQPGFGGRVEVVGSWDVFPWIVAAERAGLWVNAGWQPYDPGSSDPAVRMLDALMASTTREWANVRFDSFTVEIAKLRLARRPRVLYVALGEPDDWAHQRRYDRYLETLERADRFVEQLWTQTQADPEMAGATTLVLTTDHGRGSTGADWTGHGADVAGSEASWIAVLGPDTPAAGVLGEGSAATASQVAATVATLLGLDWNAAEHRADPPLRAAPGRR
ncbi:MAG TPA: alkaline phosphatase family protein [Thermoanaerobaculia bacterium]|nr:alkaline phosphatase family protein [Thermoanaerobaculia bacterium]